MTINSDTKIVAGHAALNQIGSTDDQTGTQSVAIDSAQWNRAALAMMVEGPEVALTELSATPLDVLPSSSRRVSVLDWNELALDLAMKRD